MNILTRDDTKHDVEYVTKADAEREIDSLMADVVNLKAKAERLYAQLNALVIAWNWDTLTERKIIIAKQCLKEME